MLFVNPPYLAPFLFRLRISALFSGLEIYIPVPIEAIASLRIASL